MKTLISAGLMLSLLAGCGRKNELSQDIDGTIEANAAAQSHIDWEASDSNPVRVFAKWQMERAESDDVCAAFRNRAGQELALFENEINKPENTVLVETCREELQALIEEYWDNVRPGAMDARLSFRFNTEVVTRDLTDGGFFVTGDLATKQVLLTFDDGPHGQFTDSILQTMAQANAKSIFFHMGNAVRRYPEVVKRVAASGHGVGSHSMTHLCLPFKNRCDTNNRKSGKKILSFAESVAEIVGGHQAVYDVLGWVDPYFRFPYGESSTELKAYLKARGTGEFYWSIDSNDWKSQTPEAMVGEVMKQLSARKRGILLFHDIHRRTAEALPLLLKELYFNGYQVVSMRPQDANARYKSQIVVPKR